MYKQLINKINEFDNIVIFRHQRPDGDAVFSQFALYTFLKDNFKNKNIQMYASSTFDTLYYKNIVKNSVLKDSLCIVIDTANKQRIDGDGAFLNCKYIIKIDHHPVTDNFGDINIVNDKASATSELLASIFLHNEFKKFILSKETCKFLYCGIISDSQSFKTSSTTKDTLLIASKIVEHGDLNIPLLNNFVFNHDIKYFNNTTKIRNLLKIKKGVGYIVANKKTLENLKMTSDEIKNRVDEFNNISKLNIWAVFAYNTKTKMYDASIRSKQKYVINTVASQYNGGGHKNAAGIKSLTYAQVNTVINKLVEISSI